MVRTFQNNINLHVIHIYHSAKTCASITSSSGVVHKVNDKGPMTKPWGTASSGPQGLDKTVIYDDTLRAIGEICLKPIQSSACDTISVMEAIKKFFVT